MKFFVLFCLCCFLCRLKIASLYFLLIRHAKRTFPDGGGGGGGLKDGKTKPWSEKIVSNGDQHLQNILYRWINPRTVSSDILSIEHHIRFEWLSFCRKQSNILTKRPDTKVHRHSIWSHWINIMTVLFDILSIGHNIRFTLLYISKLALHIMTNRPGIKVHRHDI